jgi:outer membrane protein TolC
LGGTSAGNDETGRLLLLRSPDARIGLVCTAALVLAGCGLVAASGYRDDISAPRPAPHSPDRNLDERPVIAETGPLVIGIADAVLMAFERNPGFALERLAPSRAATFEDEAASVFDPTLTSDLTDRRLDNALGAGAFTEITSASIGASITLPTGTFVGFDVDYSTTNPSLLPDTDDARLALSVTQPILRGGSKGANLAVVRQAGLDVRVSEYQLRDAAETLIADVETAYWDFALAGERIAIFEESLRLARRQLFETRARVDAGKLAGTELAAARAEVASRANNLIVARGGVESSRIRLLQLLGPPVGPTTESPASFWSREVTSLDRPGAPHAGPTDVEEHAAKALVSRPDLNSARLAIKRGDLELVRTRNGLLPRFDIFVSYGSSGFADSFSTSFEGLGDGDDIFAGLTLEYTLGNRSARARQMRARISRVEADLALANLASLAQLEVRIAHVAAQTSWERITATAAARALQDEALRAETEKFRVGKSTTFQVAQAQRDQVLSRLAEIEAVVGYLQALVALYRADGSLLERRSVGAPGAPGK